MPNAHQSRRSLRARTPKRKQFYRRWWFWAIVVVLLVIAAAAWIGVRALQAKDNLEAAVPAVSTLKEQVLAQDIDGAKKTLADVAPKVREARDLTSDPIWRAAELIPVAGSNLTAVRELADVTDSIVADAVPPLLEVVDTVMADGLKPVNGALNVALLSDAIPQIEEATAVFENASAVVNGIDTSQTIGQVTAAQKTMSDMLASIEPALDAAKQVLPLLPPALGTQGPRNYLILFQNNAEARALGGMPGALVLMTIDQGKVALGQQATGGDFRSYAPPVVAVPDGVQELYGNGFGTTMANATVRPDFPSAAQIARAMWLDEFGVAVDGVISIDPVALSYVLKATGPVPLATGEVLSSDNAVALLMNEVYIRFPGLTEEERFAQDAFFGAVVASTFGTVMQGNLDPKVLLSSMIQAIDERRLMIWSANEAETTQLVAGGLDGALPVSDGKTDEVGVYFQDAIGSKMDYYLSQRVVLSQGSCRADGRENYRVSVDVMNNAPLDAGESLTPYIVGINPDVELGDIRIDLITYAPPGSTISAIWVDGEPVEVTPFHDSQYPVAKVRTAFAPGTGRNVTFDIVAAEPGKRELAALLTPLVHPTEVVKQELDCAAVPAE